MQWPALDHATSQGSSRTKTLGQKTGFKTITYLSSQLLHVQIQDHKTISPEFTH